MDKVRELNIKGRKKSYNNIRKKRKVRMKSIDYSMLCAILILLFIGVVMVYSSSSYYALYETESKSTEFFFKKEVLWTIVGIAAMIFTMSIDYHFYKRITPWLVIGTIVCLVAVLFIGAEINGARRWIR
ncbi:stage V sporulation protein E, partial [Clostridium perfringens]|nr:stage V sporulation protein E [Clostridium perfringens]